MDFLFMFLLPLLGDLESAAKGVDCRLYENDGDLPVEN